MARRFSVRFKIMAITCVVAVGALVAASQFYSSSDHTNTPSLHQVLNSFGLPWQQRLYSGARDSSGRPLITADRAVETLRENGAEVDRRYQINKDRSTEDADFQPDGIRKQHEQTFYPIDSPGEGRHPHVATTYKGEKEKIVDQDVRRPNGKRLQSTKLADDGSKSIIDYADDGTTVVGETLFDPPDCCSEPYVRSERRWLPDADHTLIYSDLRVGDGNRTKTKFDSLHRLTWQMVCANKYCYAAGTTVIGYYPGDDTGSPLKLRFKSESDYYNDDTKYYRLDGKLWYDLQIGSSTLDVTYFDATGTKKVLEQVFFRHDETGPDRAIKMTPNSVYQIFRLQEFDSSGGEGNSFSFMDSKIDNITVKNITISGVFYSEISLYFDQKSGEFNWGVLFPKGPDSRISVKKENFTPPTLPRPSEDELKLQVPVLGDDLPVPTPQYEGYP